jgi:pyruvate formate-lyase/glycerol dehydratase family glycyl radical enzyme
MSSQKNEALFLDGKIVTRGQKLWERMLEYRRTGKISLARAKLLKKAYEETEGQLPTIRRAKAFEKIVLNIPIYIEEDDLFAGSFSVKPMYFEWYPEYAVDQDIDPEQLEELLAEGGTKKEVEEILEYFKDRCLQKSFLSRISEDEARIIDEVCDDGAWVYCAKAVLNIDRGYHAVNYEKAIQKGFAGVLKEIGKELAATSVLDEASYQKVNFLKGLKIVLEAGVQYAQRYAALARELAAKSPGPRRDELERLAEICAWVPAKPARNFYEALQTCAFLHILMLLETRGQESFGRMDQYLYPYYQKDLAGGRITKEEAIDLLECFRVKMSTLRLFDGPIFNELVSGEAQYHNITVGGQTPAGEDATNELSYLFLEAASRTRTPHPTLSIRYHKRIAEDFMLRGLALVRLGLGYPAFFNDHSAIPWLLQQGVSLEEARGYCLSGCVHHTIPGQSSPLEALFINLPKCLELALHDGFDPRTGKQLGPPTGKFEDFATFEELVKAFHSQVKYFSHQGAAIINEERVARTGIAPTLLASAFIEDCIHRGKSCLGDGARYILLGQVAVGMIDVADSLAAVKKYVFEEASIGQKELLEALTANFEGKEKLRKMLGSGPKYGNDDDYVDSLAVDLYDWWRKMAADIDAPYGIKYHPAPYSISVHGAAGKRVGALPNGRLAHTALADGAVSPCAGADTRGPTAVLNSAGKINQPPFFGTLLNMKFHPSSLKTPEDLKKLLALIKTYFDYGGKHVQFNVVDSKTLRDAQANPDRHRNLIVRVAGYSALFNELHRSIQDEIISRTEMTMP